MVIITKSLPKNIRKSWRKTCCQQDFQNNQQNQHAKLEGVDSRRQRLLAMVVERFIECNRPIASRDMAQTLGVSSATVRNELAALEELGFLAQPHTSAGRIPTREAYKNYARKFVPPAQTPESTLPESTQHSIRQAIKKTEGENRLRTALRFMSNLSGYASVAVLTSEANLEMVLLSVLTDGRVLAVVVLFGGITRELVFHAGFKPERNTLDAIETALREPSISLKDVPAKLLHLEKTSSPAISSLARALREHWGEARPTIVMSEGASTVLSEPESNNPIFLRRLLGMLEQPNLMGELNHQGRKAVAPGQFVLEVDEPHGISGIHAGFQTNIGRGTVTILGPTRMRYPQAIAVAKAVSEAVSDAS